MANDPRSAPSGYRFEELKNRETVIEKAPEQQEPRAQEATGRYAELGQGAREAEKSREFGANAQAVQREAFGQAKDAPSKPMEKDGPSPEELKPPQARQQGQFHPAPGGSQWQQNRAGSDAGERQAERSEGRKLEFFEDKNPDRKPGDGLDWKHAHAPHNQEKGAGKKLEFFEDRNPQSQDHDHEH